MKYQLYFPLRPAGWLRLSVAVRAVGVEDAGWTYECWALYAACVGYDHRSQRLGGGMRGEKHKVSLTTGGDI